MVQCNESTTLDDFSQGILVDSRVFSVTEDVGTGDDRNLIQVGPSVIRFPSTIAYQSNFHLPESFVAMEHTWTIFTSTSSERFFNAFIGRIEKQARERHYFNFMTSHGTF